MLVRLMSYTPDPDFVAGRAAAICVGGNIHDREACAKALRGALASWHESVVEHNAFTFLIEDVSRVLLAQLTRHRMASFSVESQRYCGAALEMVIPDNMARYALEDDIIDLLRRTKELHAKAVRRGVPAEDARYFTLQGGKTKLILTMNARELRHFFSLRCCNRAQWEIRELADMMLEQCREVAPQIFAKAGCACMQGKSCPEGKRSCGHPRKEDEA